MKRPTGGDLSTTLQQAARRWRAAEQDRSAAVVRGVLSGRTEALIAWIWLAPSLAKLEERARVARPSSGSASRTP